MNTTSIYAAQIAMAVRASFANRTDFLLQMFGMALNNGLFLTLWYMFFAGFGSVKGWHMPDVALMIGIIAAIVGVAGVAAGGYRDLGLSILSGEIDPLLTQPQLLLPRLIARESIVSGWGDLITAIILITFFAQVNAGEIPLVLLGIFCGTFIYVATGIAFSSLVFWTEGARSLARDVVDYVVMFSTYPDSIYSGVVKLAAYTLFPAGFIVFVPVTFVRHPSAQVALVMGGAVLAYSAAAILLFGFGLRRYRHG